MRTWLSYLFTGVDVGILLYMVALNTCYLACTVIAYVQLERHRRRWTPREIGGVMRSPATPAISIVMPAFNEASTVVASVRSLLAVNYPQFEIVVVNDGSADRTLDVLRTTFGLIRAPAAFEARLATERVRGVYRSTTLTEIVVIDKEKGGKADALNAGLNVARFPLVCVIDADSLLEPQALLRVVLPFIERPDTVAVGGIIRIANGGAIEGGRVTDLRLPRSWIVRFQIVEYLRAFLAGRMAHSALKALLIISGAFGLFRRDVLIEAGGFALDTVGEDMEIVVRLHRFCREARRPHRIVFLPDPICWTEAPGSASALAVQRNRWHRATLQVLSRHRVMIGNPHYGRVGWLATPYYFIFEAFGPLVEGLGYVVTVLGLCLGLVAWEIAELMFLAAVVYGSLISVGAVLLEETFFRRYRRLGDVAWLILCGVVENLGYRQLTTWWRLRGWLDYLRNKDGWGSIPRQGLARS